MTKKFIANILPLFFLLPLCLKSQNTSLNNDFSYYFESKFDFDSLFHLTVKPYPENLIKKEIVKDINTRSVFLNSFLNRNLASLQKKTYELRINPVLTSIISEDFSNKELLTDKKAGLTLFSSLKNKLFIGSTFFFSQSNLPEFYKLYTAETGIIPHYGHFISGKNGNYNYLSLTGDITFKASENISFSAGKNKLFLGNGYRSLFLSDNTDAYPYVKAEVNIWKIKYLWGILKMSDINVSGIRNYEILYDKATFFHYLSINLTKRINFNFFEAVITNPFDKEGRRISYDASYFNPVIFYRPVEFYKGTSDNSLMGTGLNIKIFKKTFLYSQFILDDLVISSLKDGSGWWGNKFGMQAGFKSYDFINIKGLFFRNEINAVKPYTYSHGEAYISNGIANLNYGNMIQPATHPLGANFIEGLSEIRYVKNRLSGKILIIYARKGIDTDSVSMGGDIYKSYALRPSDYGIKILQGELTDIYTYNISLSYLINPEYKLMFNTGLFFRKEKNTIYDNESLIFYFGIKTGIFNSFYD